MGGDQMSPPISPIPNVAGLCAAPRLLISPLVGEMSGRTEGGATERRHVNFNPHQNLGMSGNATCPRCTCILPSSAQRRSCG
ncbi:MAG: hypothetical protein EKK31_02145, partial [Hyphomicrobiales bacterium]